MPLIRYLIEKFDYYKEPEGKDPITKVVALSKYGLVLGGFISIYDACVYSKCLNTAQFLNTAGYWMVPLTGMCVAFSTVTYISTNIRKKDDKFNYFLGALASSSILHAWQKSPTISGPGTVVLVLIALLKKDYKQHNYAAPNKNLFIPDEMPSKWYFPWRNVYYRNYAPKGRFEYDRTDYYRNFQ